MSVFTGAESLQEAPRWWLPHTQAHRRSLSLSPPLGQASGSCYAGRSGKESLQDKKKKALSGGALPAGFTRMLALEF